MLKKFKIGKKIIGLNQPPIVIAELSANHNGSLLRALQSIKAAKKCGADFVKIQSYTADTMTINSDLPDFKIKGGLWDNYKLYNLYKWAETPYEWHKPIFDHAKKVGVTLFSTPFDETAVDLLESLNTPAYKIASFELVDLPLIKYVAQTGKPIIISTGMANEAEIEEAVTTARDAGCKKLVLLHCISNYPTQIEKAYLRKIPKLAKKYGVPVGLSDHTLTTTAAIAAVALGACVIEKHFTLNKKNKSPDQKFSLEQNEFAHLCKQVKDTWSALGNPKQQDHTSAEIKNKIFRRSIFVVQDIKKGERLTPSNLRKIRPGNGAPCKYYNHFLGKKVKKNLKKGTPFKKEFI